VAARDLNEVEIVQNAALGSVLLWRFASGFQETAYAGAPLPLLYLVLPICLQRTSLDSVIRTRRNSGLALFVARLGEGREDLYAIHTRALALRQLSTESLVVGVNAELLTLDYHEALVRANTRSAPLLPERLKSMWDAAERLGHWCATVSFPQTAALLKVNF
jgi:hypothetical protein